MCRWEWWCEIVMLDVEVIKVLAHVPEQYAGIPVLAGLGSCLGYYGDWPLRVWGTGYEPGYMDRVARSYSGTRPLWKVYAVRGYITRTILKLDSDVVIGDPAILLPRIYQPHHAPTRDTRYFLHCENDKAPDVDADIVSTHMDPFQAIDLICASRFVFTEALHVAILAHAYSIPWAWSLNKHVRGMIKWFDWFSSIGVAPKPFTPTEIDQAMRWYASVRSEFRHLNDDALLRSFPHDVIDSRLC